MICLQEESCSLTVYSITNFQCFHSSCHSHWRYNTYKVLSFRILSTSQRCRRYSTSTCERCASTSPRLRSDPHCPSSGGSAPRRKSYVPDRWSPQSTRACWFDSMPYLYITLIVLITFRLQRYCYGVSFLFTPASFLPKLEISDRIHLKMTFVCMIIQLKAIDTTSGVTATDGLHNNFLIGISNIDTLPTAMMILTIDLSLPYPISRSQVFTLQSYDKRKPASTT